MNTDNNFIPGNKKVIEIRHGDKNVEILIILIQYNSKTKLKNDKQITQYQVGDETGSILCNFYDETGEKIKEGDIILLKGAYATLFKGHLVLYTAKPGFGTVTKMGEFFMILSEVPNLSEPLYDDVQMEEHEKKLNRDRMTKTHPRNLPYK